MVRRHAVADFRRSNGLDAAGKTKSADSKPNTQPLGKSQAASRTRSHNKKIKEMIKDNKRNVDDEDRGAGFWERFARIAAVLMLLSMPWYGCKDDGLFAIHGRPDEPLCMYTGRAAQQGATVGQEGHRAAGHRQSSRQAAQEQGTAQGRAGIGR